MASSLIRFSDSFIQAVVWIILIIVRVIEIRQIGKDFRTGRALRMKSYRTVGKVTWGVAKRNVEVEDNDDLNYALAATINGIAAGLRSTG